MKKTILIVLVFLMAACSPAQPAPTTALAISTEPTVAKKVTATAAVPAQTDTQVAQSATPAPTSTPEPASEPTATSFTEPVIAERFPFYEGADGLGFGSILLALPGGQAWETTSGGGVRVYDSQTMTVQKSLDLGGLPNAFTRLVGDDSYVWALFYNRNDPASLFRISREDYKFEPVDLPSACTYDDCQWSIIQVDGDVLWVGGYDELWGYDRDTLEPVTQFLYSEQAGTFTPSDVRDLDVTDDGQIWSLFSTDVGYIVTLDRQKLLDGVDQQPGMIYFTNNTIQFVEKAGEFMVAGEDLSGINEEQPAVLYLLNELEVQLGPKDGITLPAELDINDFVGVNITTDGRYLWVLNEGGRKLFWFDPEAGQVVGVMQVYPGDEPSGDDYNMIMSISFDGKDLWTGGSEILRIALPWTE